MCRMEKIELSTEESQSTKRWHHPTHKHTQPNAIFMYTMFMFNQEMHESSVIYEIRKVKHRTHLSVIHLVGARVVHPTTFVCCLHKGKMR